MRVLLLLSFLFITGLLFAQSDPRFSFQPDCVPSACIHHKYYSLCYSTVHKQAIWVSYTLSCFMVENVNCERSDDFRTDPKVPQGASLNDYKGSGYDRGHLCPAGDMAFDCDAMSESFFMSNMSPQIPAFNRGIWKNLEGLVRSWASLYGKIWIVTGPVLSTDSLGTIGMGRVTIPSYYYKAIIRKEDSTGFTCIAFLLANQAGYNEFSDYVISIDSLECLSGIDFFPSLPDSIEDSIESKTNQNSWNFNAPTLIRNYNSSSSSNNQESRQCTAITQKGTRCKRMTSSSNGKCWQHGGD